MKHKTKRKEVEKICGNCLLYNHDKKECKVTVLAEGKEYHMPVFVKDKCHMEDLGIEVKQVRWWVEDELGKPTDGNGKVRVEYPVDIPKGYFGI